MDSVLSADASSSVGSSNSYLLSEEQNELHRDLDSLLRDFSQDTITDSPPPPPAPIPNPPTLACNECGRGGFTTIQKLLAHQQIHNKSPTFRCSLCPKSFKWSSGLRRHVENTHGPAISENERELDLEDSRRSYTCSECAMTLGCITSLAKHVRKSHGFAISIRSPYLDTLKGPCCRKNQCSGSDKRGSGLAPSVMMADAKAIKTEVKAFNCLFCNISVRREDLLDHQMVHMKDMGRGGKLTGHPEKVGGEVTSTSGKKVKKELKDEISGPSPLTQGSSNLQRIQGFGSHVAQGTYPVTDIPNLINGDNGTLVDVTALLGTIWADNPDQVPILVAGATVISYCKSCWKICQMEIPPGKIEIDLSEFRCYACACADLVTGPSKNGPSTEGGSEGINWHQPSNSSSLLQTIMAANGVPRSVGGVGVGGGGSGGGGVGHVHHSRSRATLTT